MIGLVIEGLEQLVGLKVGLNTAADEFPAEVSTVMDMGLTVLEADMREHVARDTGQLGNSLNHRIVRQGTSVQGYIGASAGTWPFVEFGTRPHWPPIAAITPWANRHGIAPFLVARAISRRGTKAQPFVEPAWTRQRSRVEALFATVGLKVVATIRRGTSR